MSALRMYPLKRLLQASVFACTIAGTRIWAAPPTWWSESSTSVIDPTAAPNNHGVANIGQAKWMAKNALNVVRAIHPATADAIEADLVGSSKPIVSWDAPVTQAQKDAQRAPLLIGQLKAIAAPFYSKLHTLDAVWLDGQLTQNQTKDSSDSGNYFPWTSGTTDDANKAVATIGQLKAVFSLRFEGLSSGSLVDSDADGLPDDWEANLLQWLNAQDPQNPLTDIAPGGDADSDGLKNLHEYQVHTDPTFPDHPALQLQVAGYAQ